MIRIEPARTTAGRDKAMESVVEATGPLGVSHFRIGGNRSIRVLGMGGESKSSICFLRGRTAILTGSIGDLREPSHYRRYCSLLESLSANLRFHADVIAHDLHPLYLSCVVARAQHVPCIGVQHHHAHAVSVMTEWDVDKRVAAICCDGMGYGTDGAAWGCEVLTCDRACYVRRGHLAYFPLVGGDRAAIETWRPAAALLRMAFGDDWRERLTPSLEALGDGPLDLFEQLDGMHVNAPMTSSLGRLFDGVSSMLGLCTVNDTEAAAARAVDTAAIQRAVEPYPYATPVDGGNVILDPSPMVRAIVRDLRAGRPVGEIAARFHETLTRMLASAAEMVCESEGLSTVILAGGCFANERLRDRLSERLSRRHLRVLKARRTPFGDGGLALGQAVAAAAIHEGVQRCA